MFFRTGYALPFAFGGFMLLYSVMYLLAPAVIGVATSDELSGFNQSATRDAELFHYLLLFGGLGLTVYFGSQMLRSQVEEQLEQERTGATPVDRLAADLRLNVEVDPTHKHKVLTGRRGGHFVKVHLERRQTRLVARHNLKLPPGFQIIAGKKKGDKFGNVVLDGALVGEKLSALTVDWTHPRTTALLMELLQQHPGSVVDHTSVTVKGKLKTEDLDRLLDGIAELVNHLSTPMKAAERPRFPGRDA